MQVKQIETYSLYEFCQAVEQAVLDGYRFDFDSNSRFPQAFGSLMTAGMVKVSEIKAEESEQEVTPIEVTQVIEDKPVVKLGRKPRG